MSDSKISDLPAATTPLAGTELLEVVQTGANKKVAAADVGRLYTAGAGLQLSGAEFSAYAPFGDPNVAVFFDDFLGSLFNVIGFFANGGGSSLEGGNAFGAPGVMQLNTGTGSTGRGGVIWPITNTAANQVIYFGAGRADFQIRGRVSALSDGTNTYSVRAGFTRDPAISTPQDGLFFEYDPTTRGNDNWWCVSRNNNSNRAIDSAVAASISAFQVLSIEVNAAGTEAVSRIDGTVVDTNTTNIPSGSSRRTGYGAAIQKSAGTTGRTLQVDYLLVALHFPSGRP